MYKLNFKPDFKKMIKSKELKKIIIISVIFLICFYLPLGNLRFDNAILESLWLVRSYAREHVLLCLLPAFLISGAIMIFVSQNSVVKYLGNKTHKVLAYSFASISGTILSVCSCTVLPLFAGIYRSGAGLGPAITFLYSGPAINILAIVLTARILGISLGIARAIGAIIFSIVIGLIMHALFHDNDNDKLPQRMNITESSRSLWINVIYFLLMVGILFFANASTISDSSGLWLLICNAKWIITATLAVLLGITLVVWFGFVWWYLLITAFAVVSSAYLLSAYPIVAFFVGILGLSISAIKSNNESKNWISSSWQLTKQILPLLLVGVLVSGFFLGRPGHEGFIPSSWIYSWVGSNSLSANLFASVIGAFMYFATLTEVPIVQGLMANGMHKGPALALLLAGPALSLPNMLVIRSVLGTKKTLTFVLFVIVMATISGMTYGTFC